MDDDEEDYADMEESFSFTCFDFNNGEGSEESENEDDEESYIEISLEPVLIKDDCHDLKLRVSFSSSRVPLKELFSDGATAGEEASPLSPSKNGCLSGENFGRRKRRKIRVPVIIDRVVSTFFPSFRAAAVQEGGRREEGWERRKSSNTPTGINGSMMRMLIKLRSVKMGPIIWSIIRPRRSEEERSNIIEVHSRKMVEMNLEGIRGVLEAMSNLSIGRRSKQTKTKTKTKSCPGSIKTSPLHTTENSVQAAIAHCKRSLGQTQDFCF